jgi:DNA polymerase-3 subunit alpha
VRTVAEARSMGITVLPPDVNVSAIDFTVVYEPDTTGKVKRPKKTPVAHRGKVKDPMGPRIRFGLGGVRGVGESALDAIFEERSGRATWERDGRAGEPKKEPFVDVFDLAARVDLRRVNKNVCIALVQCGGFDALHEPLGVTRAMASAAVESAIERGKKLAQERQSGQTNLFGLFGGGNDAATKAMSRGGTFPKVEPWDTRELLAKEKQTLGFYVSGHPLDRYAAELRRFCNATTDSLPELDDRTEVTVGGSVEGYRERTTKTGRRIAFFDLEDPFGRVEVIVRPRVLADEGLRDVLQSGEPVIVTGSVQHEEERGASEGDKTEAKLILDGVSLLSVSLKKKTTSVLVRLVVDRVDRMRLEALKQCLLAHPGGCPVTLELTEGKKWTVAMPQTGLSVEPSDALLASLERLFGEKVCELR